MGEVGLHLADPPRIRLGVQPEPARRARLVKQADRDSFQFRFRIPLPLDIHVHFRACFPGAPSREFVPVLPGASMTDAPGCVLLQQRLGHALRKQRVLVVNREHAPCRERHVSRPMQARARPYGERTGMVTPNADGIALVERAYDGHAWEGLFEPGHGTIPSCSGRRDRGSKRVSHYGGAPFPDPRGKHGQPPQGR